MCLRLRLKILNIYEFKKYLTAIFMYSYHHNKPPVHFNKSLDCYKLKYTYLARHQHQKYILNFQEQIMEHFLLDIGEQLFETIYQVILEA